MRKPGRRPYPPASCPANDSARRWGSDTLRQMARAQRSGAAEAASSSPVNSKSPLEAQARRLIDEILRPLIAVDGGAIELVSVTEARLLVRLTGTCSGCPGRPYTVSGVIERAARKYLSPTIQVDVADD